MWEIYENALNIINIILRNTKEENKKIQIRRLYNV